MRYITIACLLLQSFILLGQSLRVTALHCEYVITPLGVDIPQPVLGWKLESDQYNKSQSAYEIEVASSLQLINQGKADMWRSGKIKSRQSIGIVYQGRTLTSFSRYYWRVRVYDEKGLVSGWSDITWFETAMLHATDWKAHWINDGKKIPEKDEDFYKEDPMPVFKKVFTTDKQIRSARLYITGAGYYEAYLNGKKISDEALTPGWTNFDKRILYRTYDVTALVSSGKNIIGVQVGNGWYNPLPMRFWGKYNLRDALTTGRPSVIAQLRLMYVDGTISEIITDHSWQYQEGAVIKNNVYLGETYDARNVTQWLSDTEMHNGKQAMVVEGPKGKLVADLQPQVRVKRIVKPVAINEVSKGVYVADMGENFAGVAQIKVNAPRGTRISLRYGEDVYNDGQLNGMTTVAGQIKKGNGGPGAPPIAWQQDCYIAAGNDIEVWSPRFTFHVFRYVEIKGWPGVPTPDDISGLVMHADVSVSGAFECSNDLFNKIQENVLRTFKSNIFSVQSDCAGREKFGYGGDLFCTLESFCYNFDMHNFYRKVLQDFEDDQRPLGGIPETAPFVGLHDKGPGDQSGPLGWQLGYPYLVEKLYEFYGDKRVIEKHYASLQKQIAFLEKNARDFLYDEDISDHESLEEKPEALTASLFYYHHAMLMERFSRLLDKNTDTERYARLCAQIKEAILHKFYKGDGVFDNGTQAAQIFPLWYDIINTDEKNQIRDRMKEAFEKKQNHVHTGIFATKMMFDVMRRENEQELAYTIVNQKDYPGWGHMIEKGATTIWETWKYSDNVYSQNHPMFGSVTEWFYRSILGINASEPAFRSFSIKPFIADDLNYAKGYYDSPYGRIICDWKKERNDFILKVSVPVNTTALIYLPCHAQYAQHVKELITSNVPLKYVKREKKYLVFKAGSGTYQLRSILK